MSRCTKSAFTLIELLVVVAIITLLVSMLMPTLGRAKIIAKRTYCRANLHDVYIGLRMYLNDDDEFMPYAAEMPSLKISPYGRVCDALSKYVANPKIFTCPADVEKKYYVSEGSSYEYHESLSGVKVDAKYIVKLLQGGGRNGQTGIVRVIVLNDYEPFHGPIGHFVPFDPGADFDDPARAQGGPGYENFLFVDGHVGDYE